MRHPRGEIFLGRAPQRFPLRKYCWSANWRTLDSQATCGSWIYWSLLQELWDGASLAQPRGGIMLLCALVSISLLLCAEASPILAQNPSVAGMFIPGAHLNSTSNDEINCYPPERTVFVPAFCAEVFFQIRKLADFQDTQEFLEGVRPQIDPDNPESKPPFGFIDERRDCTLILRSRRHTLPDEFSWEQVNQLGLAIVRKCPRNGGYGYIGEEGRWILKIGGYGPGRHWEVTKEGSGGTEVAAIAL